MNPTMPRPPFGAALFALALSACAGALPSYNLSVRDLAASPSQPTHPPNGVAVAAEPITGATWRAHPEIVAHAEWTTTNESSYAHGATAGSDMTSFDVSSRSNLRSADLPLVPLPSFIVRIVNHTGKPLRLGAAQVRLTDDRGHAFPLVGSSDELRQTMRAQMVARFPDLETPNNRHTLDELDQAVGALRILASGLIVPPGGDWQGIAIFDLATTDPKLMRDFMVHAARLTLEVDVGAPLRFAFDVERKTQSTRCPTGTWECLKNDTTLPIADGPCVQRTLKPRSMGQVQWWMGDTAVANSDVQRTLAADPLTHSLARRGLILRGVGYGLVGLGLISAALSTPLFAHYYGPYIAPAGVSFAGISIVGAVIGVMGVHRNEDALRLYNAQAGATGLCAPVW